MIRLRLNWLGPASGFSVMHFDGDASNAQAAATAVSVWWDEINDRFANAQSMRVDPEVSIIDQSTGNTIGSTTITSSAIAGTAGAVQVSQAAMVLVRWRTGAFLNGREIRGRTFLPGLSSAEMTANGEVSANTITDINAANTALLAATPPLVIYSDTWHSMAEVSSASVWNEFAVLRGRRQ